MKRKLRKLLPNRIKPIITKAHLLLQPGEMQHSMVNESKVLALIVGQSVLDCGCGIGRWGYLIKRRYPIRIVVGLDIDRRHLFFLKRKKYYDFLIQGDIAYLPFTLKSFDTALAIEVIEHQTKEMGPTFLKYLDRVTTRRIILTTPSGFYKTDFCGFEAHKSGWTKVELEKYGYKVSEYTWGNHKWLFAIKDIH